MRNALDIRTYFVTHFARVGDMLGMLVLATVVTIGTAQAKNAAAISSHASLSGIQAAIVHARDSEQRRLRALRLRSLQPPAANPSPH
jgi:hypothetical protein